MMKSSVEEALPLDMLESRVDNWIGSQLSNGSQ